MITTVANVVITYGNLVLAHDNLGIARSSRELAATLLRENLQRLLAGSGAQSEVTTARAQVAQREEAILVAENAVRINENDLRELIGEKSFPSGRPAHQGRGGNPLPTWWSIRPTTTGRH